MNTHQFVLHTNSSLHSPSQGSAFTLFCLSCTMPASPPTILSKLARACESSVQPNIIGSAPASSWQLLLWPVSALEGKFPKGKFSKYVRKYQSTDCVCIDPQAEHRMSGNILMCTVAALCESTIVLRVPGATLDNPVASSLSVGTP